MISAWVTIKNPKTNGLPYYESMMSILPIVDEYIVIDGGSDDGSLEVYKGIEKVRIISDENTQMGKEWTFSQIARNFDRAFQECRGDIVINLDADYLLHEEDLDLFKKDCQIAYEKDNITISDSRFNFILADRYHMKRDKVMAVNKSLCRKKRLDVRYGMDVKTFGWGVDPIVYEKTEYDINMGKLLGYFGVKRLSTARFFNYSYLFRDEEVAKEYWYYYRLAECSLPFSKLKIPENKEESWSGFLKQCKSGVIKPATIIPLEAHPKNIQERIRNIKPNQQGYNCYGIAPVATYYEKNNG